MLVVMVSAHIVSYLLAHLEPIPDGMLVRHKCKNNRKCVNPDHLELGDHKANAEDRKRDNTATVGEKASGSKLVNKQVREIIENLGNGETVEQRAKKYGVSTTVINLIDVGKTWRHLMTEEEKKIRDDKRGEKVEIKKDKNEF